jgi:hypothetical protein
VLFASLEMNLPSIKYFIDTMAPSYSGEELELLQRNFIIFPHGNAINLMLEESRKGFESLIQKENPEGIYIDSLQKIYLGDLSKDEIRGIYIYLSYLRQEYGVYIFLIHHDRKATEGNKRPRDLSDIYGSTYITAEPDSVLHLWRKDPSLNEIELRPLKTRLSKTPGVTYLKRTDALRFQTLTGEEAERAASNFSGLQQSIDRGPPPALSPFRGFPQGSN